MIRNDAQHFGLVTRLFHWVMAALIVALLILGTRLAHIQPGLANLWLFGLHKTMGLIALGFAVARLAWHHFTPPPDALGSPLAWDNRLARLVRRLLYLLMLLVPVSGWVYASATGLDTVFANRWIVPPIAPVSEAWEDGAKLVHFILTRLLIGALILHVGGALRRAWARDGTLRRMIVG